jgi:hypothetical protein
MTPDRHRILFSRTEPWSSLGLLRRVARVCRILFGLVLFSSFLWAILLAVRGVALSDSFGQAVLCLVLVPFLILLAWSIGGMYIWRGVRRPPGPSSGGPPPPEPPEPPVEGAPRPAPLRPFSPRVLTAYAKLPNAPMNEAPLP